MRASVMRALPMAALTVLLPWAGPVRAQQPTPMSHAMPGMASPPKAGGDADKAMMAGMAKMDRDMAKAPMTGDPDRDFVAMMIPHHQGAVDMAKTVLKYGSDPDIRQLAEAIVAAQDKEIAEMRAWQAKHAGQ